MSTNLWTLEKGLCRCCHAEGKFQNLAEPCFDSGQEEIYADMLKDCFCINLVPVPGVLCTMTYTICEACITRLRDAATFRKNVAACEEKFKDYYNRNIIKVEDLPIEVKVKVEEPDPCQDDDYSLPDDNNHNFDDLPDYGFDDDDSKAELEVNLKKKQKKEHIKSKNASKSKSKLSSKGKKLGRPKKMKEEPIGEEEPVGEEEEVDKRKDYTKETASYYTFERADDGSHNYTCTACDKVYKSLASVVQHYRHVHLRLRPKLRSCYFCEVRVPGYLRAFHLEKEHGIPAPTCNACGKKFAYPFQVLRHQKHDHMGEKKFECEICDMKFTSQRNLSQHFIKHSSIRLHRCEYCEKSFKWKKNLKTHILMHLNDRRHVCSVCQEAFVQQSSLKYHIMKRHPEMV